MCTGFHFVAVIAGFVTLRCVWRLLISKYFWVLLFGRGGIHRSFFGMQKEIVLGILAGEKRPRVSGPERRGKGSGWEPTFSILFFFIFHFIQVFRGFLLAVLDICEAQGGVLRCAVVKEVKLDHR